MTTEVAEGWRLFARALRCLASIGLPDAPAALRVLSFVDQLAPRLAAAAQPQSLPDSVAVFLSVTAQPVRSSVRACVPPKLDHKPHTQAENTSRALAAWTMRICARLLNARGDLPATLPLLQRALALVEEEPPRLYRAELAGLLGALLRKCVALRVAELRARRLCPHHPPTRRAQQQQAAAQVLATACDDYEAALGTALQRGWTHDPNCLPFFPAAFGELALAKLTAGDAAAECQSVIFRSVNALHRACTACRSCAGGGAVAWI